MNIFEGLHIRFDLKEYPNSVLFFKKDKFWMEYNWKNKILWCRWEGFWRVLKRENNWSYREVQAFIKDWVEQGFKLKGVTPPPDNTRQHEQVEQGFKLKGVTPRYK